MVQFEKLEILISRLQDFEDNINQIVKEAILENIDAIIRLQIDQLDRGVTTENTSIQPPYAQSTIIAKIRKGQPTNRVTLKDTGDFYNSFTIEVNDDNFEIKPTVFYAQFLLRRYSQIIGLTEDNLKTVAETYILPKLIENGSKIFSES